MGKLLAETERATGGDAQRTRYQHITESPLTLSELGITKRESAEAQKLAKLPERSYLVLLRLPPFPRGLN